MKATIRKNPMQHFAWLRKKAWVIEREDHSQGYEQYQVNMLVVLDTINATLESVKGTCQLAFKSQALSGSPPKDAQALYCLSFAHHPYAITSNKPGVAQWNLI